ncbi:hypothetical protein BX666DRAFT_588810 [Dichotomocladium elegans]|nr:hypothetical protein BX666DRAFT_588810 [Dichotomocladium elegans]
MSAQEKLQALQQHIDTILETLSWNRDEIKQWYTEEQTHKTQCAFDDRHYVPRDKLAQHEKQCQDKQLRMKDRQPKLPSSLKYFYKYPPRENQEATAVEPLDHPSNDLGNDEDTYAGDPLLDKSSSGERDIKRRPKTYRVRVTKHRRPIEVQRQLVQAYMQEFQSHRDSKKQYDVPISAASRHEPNPP